jgi:MFS family permease
VAANKGARFSLAGYGKLTNRARRDRKLTLALGRRSDLPRQYFLKLLETASASVRAKLAGVPVGQAAIATMLFQFGGTLAGLMSMRFLDKRGFIPVPILFACAIPIVACIGIPNHSPYVLLALVAAAGFCILGVQFGNIATEGNIYPTYIRAWGVGSNFAVGRIGGALGPLLGGFAFAAKLPAQQIFLIATLPLILGLIATLAIVPLYRRHVRMMRADREGVSMPQAVPSRP